MLLDVARRDLPLYQKHGQLHDVADEDADPCLLVGLLDGAVLPVSDRTGNVASVTKVSDFSTMTALRRTDCCCSVDPGSERDRAVLTLPRPPMIACSFLATAGGR